MIQSNSHKYKMEVIKRNGQRELVKFDKITSRIENLLSIMNYYI